MTARHTYYSSTISPVCRKGKGEELDANVGFADNFVGIMGTSEVDEAAVNFFKGAGVGHDNIFHNMVVSANNDATTSGYDFEGRKDQFSRSTKLFVEYVDFTTSNNLTFIDTAKVVPRYSCGWVHLPPRHGHQQ